MVKVGVGWRIGGGEVRWTVILYNSQWSVVRGERDQFSV